MRNLITITKLILFRTLKKPSAILLHVVLPIVASIVLFSLMSINDGNTIAVGISDLDQTVSSKHFIEALNTSNNLNIYPYNSTQIENGVLNREIVIGITIPNGFEQSILDGNNLPLGIHTLQTNNGVSWLSESLSFQTENLLLLAKDASKEVYHDRIASLDNELITVNTIYTEDVSATKQATVNTFGLYLMLLMITTMTISFKIIDEKDKGTFDRIGLAPVPAKIYAYSNILANFIIASVQIFIVLFALGIILGVNLYANPIAIYGMLILFALVSISLGVLIAAFSKSMAMATGMMALILSPSSMIAGCFWPIKYMPMYLQKLAYTMPQRWTLDGINLIQKQASITDVLPHMIILLSFTALFSLLATHQFKKHAL